MKLGKKIEILAHTDEITGLPNRLHFNEFLQRCIASQGIEAKPFCVMFVDLDSFRIVNDTHGYTMGDSILHITGRRIRQAISEEDFVARLSADAFACILRSRSDVKAAYKVADQIIDALRQPYLVEKESIGLQAKIGISIFPKDAVDGSTLLKYADTAMRRAKFDGGRGVEAFDLSLDAQMLAEWSLHVDLGHAIERGELLLYYQPKVSSQTAELTGYEALIRWKHSVRGLISPGEFIPVAERTRMIIPIGEWVLMEACRQGRKWLDKGFPRVPIAVNISADQFQHGNIKQTVVQALGSV